MKPYIYLSGIVLLLCSCSGRDRPKDGGKPDAAIPVTLAKVERAVRTEPVSTAGTVSSLSEVRLSFKVGGVIDKIYVSEGQEVKAGQLLATLNLTETEAQVSQAQLAYEKSIRDLERLKNLLRDSAATYEQFQNAKTGSDVAAQNLGVARFNMDFSRITSPVSGTIVKKLMSDGEVTGPGSPVLMVVSNKKNDWVVRVGVSDRDWARLKPGDKAEVELDAYPDDQLTGLVSFLSVVADPATHLYEAEVRLTGKIPRMASGLFAKVKLWPSQSRFFEIIPVEALLEGHGNDGFVFVAEDGKAKKKQVKIGYLDGDNVLLTSGLDSAGYVIKGGSAFLTDGSPVTVKE